MIVNIDGRVYEGKEVTVEEYNYYTNVGDFEKEHLDSKIRKS